MGNITILLHYTAVQNVYNILLWLLILIKAIKIMSLTPTTSEGKSFTMLPTKCTLILLPSGSDSSKESNVVYSAM